MSDLDLLVEMFAKVGRPVVEKKSAGKKPTITYEPIVLDLSWMNDYDAATAPESQRRFETAVANIAPGDISQLGELVSNLNNFLNTPAKQLINDHVTAIAMVDVMRTLYHLLTSPNPSVKGYTFEQFIAKLFGGKVIKGIADNIADVEFPQGNVSLKFVKPKSSVKGSYANLSTEVQKNEEIRYYVGEKILDKKNPKIRFYTFVITREQAIYMLRTIKKNKMSPLLDKKGNAFSLSPTELNKGVYQMKELGVLNMGDMVGKTDAIFRLLDQKFQGLFSTLQELAEAADRFKTDSATTSDPGKRQQSKQDTIKKTDATKAAAQKI